MDSWAGKTEVGSGLGARWGCAL